MRRILILLALCAMALSLVACGDDDTDSEVGGDTTPDEAPDASEPEEPVDSTEADDTTDEDDPDDDADDAMSEGGDGVPSSDEICEAIVAPLEVIYGPSTEVEAGDGSYPSCDARFEPARVVVSAFALDDPLVGGDFDAYIDEVGETITGLEPLDGIGDQAVANDSGQAYVLVGENILTVSRAFTSEGGDSGDLAGVVSGVADALG